MEYSWRSDLHLDRCQSQTSPNPLHLTRKLDRPFEIMRRRLAGTSFAASPALSAFSLAETSQPGIVGDQTEARRIGRKGAGQFFPGAAGGKGVSLSGHGTRKHSNSRDVYQDADTVLSSHLVKANMIEVVRARGLDQLSPRGPSTVIRRWSAGYHGAPSRSQSASSSSTTAPARASCLRCGHCDR